MARSPSQIPEPPITKFLFADTRISFVWLTLRVYVGWLWVQAGWEKITSSSWVGSGAGTALHGFLMGAVQKSVGAHPDVSGWYVAFINGFVIHHIAVFSYVISFGELAVGMGLILGMFTGIAAFFGAFMNMNYLFAGTVSVNPVMFLIELFIILAWRVAGWWGVDRYLLPFLGTPWQKGSLFRK